MSQLRGGAAFLAWAALVLSCGQPDPSPGFDDESPPVGSPSGSAPATSGARSSRSGSSAGAASGVASSGSRAGSGATSPAPYSGGASNTSGAASDDEAGTPDGSIAANDPNTVTLTMGDFTVGAGQEVFMCQDFDNPFGGQDVAIGRSESDMTVGSHHLHVFYGEDSPPVRTVQPCANPFEFRSLLHVGGLPVVVTQYPAGMAAKLKGTLGVRLQVHHLNTGTTTLDGHVSVKLTKVDPATVSKWIAELYFNRVVLTVPVGTGQTVATTCTVPADFGPIGLISGQSHMHMRGVHFVATTSTGVGLADTTVWNDPPITPYNPPIMLNPGDSISWTCTYNNQTGNTLTFGDSAQKNEMCIFLARYYSSPSGNDIECQSPSPNGSGAVTAGVAGM